MITTITSAILRPGRGGMWRDVERCRLSASRVLSLGLLAIAVLAAPQSLMALEEVVIIYKRKQPAPVAQPVQAQAQSHQQPRILRHKPDYDQTLSQRLPQGASMDKKDDAIYRALWNHPNQVFIDTGMGPMPLFTDVIYDAGGNPQPRFPDYFTYQFMSDPTPEHARLYLESNSARWRRIKQATTTMKQASIDYGYVVPADFERKTQGEVPGHVSIYDPSAIEEESRGMPIMDRKMALYRGLDPAQIPKTPAPGRAKLVECILFWDWRDTISHDAMMDYAKFSHWLKNAKTDVRVMTISLDTHRERVRSHLRYFQHRQFNEFRTVENLLDVTNLRKAFSLRVTPSYIMIDRRSGSILRREGIQDFKQLKAALYELVKKQEYIDEEPRPSWFSNAPVHEVESEESRGLFSGSNKSKDGVEGATPIMPRSHPAPWIPDDQQIKDALKGKEEGRQ